MKDSTLQTTASDSRQSSTMSSSMCSGSSSSKSTNGESSYPISSVTQAFSVIDGTESLISLRSSWSGSINLRILWMNKIQRMDVSWVVCSSYSGLCASVMSVPKECVTNCLTDDGMRSYLDLIIITSTLLAVTVLCSFAFPSVSFVIMSVGIEDFGKSYWSHNEASGALDKPSGLFFATVEWNAT